jgi:hypothetical protein
MPPSRFHQQFDLTLARAAALNQAIAELRSLAVALWVLHGS